MVGASAIQGEHVLHVFDRHDGALLKILEGPTTQCVAQLAWHPGRPVLAVIAVEGKARVLGGLFGGEGGERRREAACAAQVP